AESVGARDLRGRQEITSASYVKIRRVKQDAIGKQSIRQIRSKGIRDATRDAAGRERIDDVGDLRFGFRLQVAGRSVRERKSFSGETSAASDGEIADIGIELNLV